MAHLAYHCKNWQKHFGRSRHWTGPAYCRPPNAGPGWWRWPGPDVNWLICSRNSTASVILFVTWHLEKNKNKAKSHTHMSSMFGSVNCTKRSLSWSTPECLKGTCYKLRSYKCLVEFCWVLPRPTGSDLSPGVATMIWSRDSLFVSIL